MKCPRCQRENLPEAKFCLECATPLALRCVNCGTPLPAGAKFCVECATPVSGRGSTTRFASPEAYTPKHLAEKILTSRAALEGERKQVTVLFVDVSGFTSLSERLDPEEVHRLMNRAFDLMLAEVHRYEGTVNQFLGDGIMALFGAPIAHEDHARRAVQAALGIRRALEDYRKELEPRGITFQARQGVNTGLVVVGSVGGDLRMDYTAVGDTTNVAARLQQASEPGRVTIADATQRLARGYFDMRPLGEMHLKGKSDPVGAWEVIAAHETRTRLEVESARGLTPFVGRDRELGSLLEAFARARAGLGQVALLAGDAGIGKSRLLLELRNRIGDAADWREGHCLSFGRAMTLHPLVDLVRRQFAIEDTDGDGAIAAKLERGVDEVGADLARAVPYLKTLLSVDPGDADVRAMTPVQRRGETFEALRRLLAAAAVRRPQVYVIEDLHWIDSTSEQFLGSLVDSVPALPVLLVFTCRPGYAVPFADRSYVTRIVPAVLSADESARMAAAVLAADRLPDELRGLLAGKAEGNPFYVEELVKSLEESGALRRAGDRYELACAVGAISVPGTIQDVIAARIDRLPEAPKRTLQLAAVIGREFTRRLVDRVAELRERSEDLRELTALELIHERRLFPELAYMFNHALTQDVAYASLLLQRRKELHRLVGLAIEELYADRLAEHYEMLAHHFFQAEEWERALDYLLNATEKATRAFGLRQALELNTRALAVVDRLGDRVPAVTRLAIHRARVDLYFGIGEFLHSRDAAQFLVELTRREGDRAAEATALVQHASGLQWTEDFPAAFERAQEAITIAEENGAQNPLAGALFVRGYMHSINGNHDQGETDVSRALAIGRAIGDPNRQALALHVLAGLRGWQGEYRTSLELARDGARLAQEHRLIIPLIRCLWNQGAAANDMGDYDTSLAMLTEGLALAEKIGDDAFIPRFQNTIGWLYIDCGAFARGIAASEQSYEVTGRSSRAGHATGAERRAFIRSNEADAMMVQGDLAAAGNALEEAYHVVQHPPPSRWMTWRYSTHCYASLGQLALLRGDADRGRRMAEQSLEIAVPTRSRKFESWAWRLKGESATARRAWGEAEEALRRALTIAEAIAQPRQTWLSQAALGHLFTALGRHEDARERYRAAWSIISALQARTRDPELRGGLESSPLVREIAEHVR